MVEWVGENEHCARCLPCASSKTYTFLLFCKGSLLTVKAIAFPCLVICTIDWTCHERLSMRKKFPVFAGGALTLQAKKPFQACAYRPSSLTGLGLMGPIDPSLLFGASMYNPALSLGGAYSSRPRNV